MILIDMEMPKSCSGCKFYYTSGYKDEKYYNCVVNEKDDFTSGYYSKKHPKCPLQQPDPVVQHITKAVHTLEKHKNIKDGVYTDEVEMLFDIRNNKEISCISHLGDFAYKITSKGWRELKQVFSNQQKEIQRHKNAFKTQGNILTRQNQELQSKLDKFIKELELVSTDDLISTGELSKQAFAKKLLKIIKEATK